MVRVSGKQDVDQLLLRLGTAIRTRRLATGLSQEALADAAGVDRSHMGKIERGERNVTTLLLIDVAGALDVTVASLFEDARL
ncbi:helix-turn-helix transcriptional regulator [Sphingomonas sp. NBWT7]|uniref:helix-turn-helix domain-containing protein n=1 Tax=Sphingomonas sp. NBWT7 TaxID=2596913 RepID=UPI001624A98B|nr:helix-turn-helix transcriptional regulator [Sphingomonas sp. NBWT7]QNE32515.1 helix-turn-helix transcriptional regulator [Sphingomonas sp. NBWT7]